MTELNPLHGQPVSPEQQTALERELDAQVPRRADRRGQMDPRDVERGRNKQQMQAHLDASRNLFLETREDVWRSRAVDPKTPFRHGHPPQPPLPLTDNQLRRGEMTQLERIKHRAKHNEEEYKGRS